MCSVIAIGKLVWEDLWRRMWKLIFSLLEVWEGGAQAITQNIFETWPGQMRWKYWGQMRWKWGRGIGNTLQEIGANWGSAGHEVIGEWLSGLRKLKCHCTKFLSATPLFAKLGWCWWVFECQLSADADIPITHGWYWLIDTPNIEYLKVNQMAFGQMDQGRIVE